MARNDPQINIRLPAALKERIDVAAKENNRSMNAEIVTRLEQSFFERLPIVAPNLKNMRNEDDVLALLAQTIHDLGKYQEHYQSLLRLKRGDFDKKRIADSGDLEDDD